MEDKKAAREKEMQIAMEERRFERETQVEKLKHQREMAKLETEHTLRMKELPPPLFLRLIGTKTMSAEMVGTIRSALLVVGSITIVIMIAWRKLSGWEILEGRVADLNATVMAYMSGNHREVEEPKSVLTSTTPDATKSAK